MNIVEGNKILILDIETCGFLKAGGSIVEIGIVELDLDTGTVIDVFESLVREPILQKKHREPPMDWIFQNSNLKVDSVREAPPADEVFPKVQAILDSYPMGCTAYNKAFDFDFLRDRGMKIKDLPCPMILATDICKLPGNYGFKWPKVEEAFAHFYPDIEYTEEHRGLDDARHEAMIVWALYRDGVFKLESSDE